MCNYWFNDCAQCQHSSFNTFCSIHCSICIVSPTLFVVQTPFSHHRFRWWNCENRNRTCTTPVREICIIVHVGGTRCVTWSIDRIIQIHACITWGVEFIRAIFFIFFFYVWLTLPIRSNARFFSMFDFIRWDVRWGTFLHHVGLVDVLDQQHRFPLHVHGRVRRVHGRKEPTDQC